MLSASEAIMDSSGKLSSLEDFIKNNIPEVKNGWQIVKKLSAQDISNDITVPDEVLPVFAENEYTELLIYLKGKAYSDTVYTQLTFVIPTDILKDNEEYFGLPYGKPPAAEWAANLFFRFYKSDNVLKMQFKRGSNGIPATSWDITFYIK